MIIEFSNIEQLYTINSINLYWTYTEYSTPLEQTNFFRVLFILFHSRNFVGTAIFNCTNYFYPSMHKTDRYLNILGKS